MDRTGNSYVVVFAVAICVVRSASLALTFNALKPTIDANREFDMQKNILVAAGLYDPAGAPRTHEELKQLYQDRVVESVIEAETGETVEGKLPADLKDLVKETANNPEFYDYLALYEVKLDDGRTSYCLPTLQYGLWSWMKGFIAVNTDCTEVYGITYYEQGETPGLGGECVNPVWQKQWVGKKLFDETGVFVSVTVKKGMVNPDDLNEVNHFVDGLAGATITSNGITRDLKANIGAYDAFFAGKRGQ